MKLFFITLISLSSLLSSATKNQNWQLIGFQKIELMKKAKEAVKLNTYKSNNKEAYTISYELAGKTQREKVIPLETYSSLQQELESDVIAKGLHPKKMNCQDRIELTIKNEKITNKSVCLKIVGARTAVQKNFGVWYRKAMAELGL